MDVFTNTKKFKKILIVLVFLILFNFCCPKIVKAGWDIDERILLTIEKLFFWMFDGIQEIVDNLFIDDEIKKTFEAESDEDRVKSFGGDKNVVVSAENIIKGKFLLMDPNIFKKVDDSNINEYLDYNKVQLGRNSLRNTISGWYYALRNLAIVALLSILVYVAIRMILSTISQDKAKYKMMFKDWLVALCLLFLMHYIMVGILNLSSTITNAIGTSGTALTATGELRDDIEKAIGTADAALEGTKDEDIAAYKTKEALKWTVIYAAIVIMNVIFVGKYVIRALTIIFLVLLAPITCITYPIDKISDGKAQAYDMWFKEFLYQVIIQPFHLLIYIVLIGSAAQLASENLIYAMLCFGVMIPAEKFIKQMFGFKDKLGSPLGSFASGAIAGQLLNKAFSGGGSGGSKGDKVEGKSDSDTFRESKLKPGLPDSDHGGETTTYESSDSSEQSDSSTGDGSGGNGSGEDGTGEDGIGEDGIGEDGIGEDGIGGDGTGEDGTGEDGTGEDGTGGDGTGEDGTGEDGTGEDGTGENRTGRNGTGTPAGIYTPNGKKSSKVGNAARAIREHRDKKLMAKYGTKNRLKAAGKYAVRKGAKAGKKAIKGAATLTAAVGLGAFGAMFGQGEKAAMLGASIGGTVGTGINNKLSGAYETTKEYGKEAIYATRDEDKRREKRVEKMMHTPDQIEKASKSFSKRNDGKIANTKELNQELEERAKFKETGLTDSQIDDAIDIYKDNISNMGEDKAFAMAVRSAEEASRYKASDFDDPKKVKYMYDRMMNEYKALGVNQDLADENVRAIIENAAKTHKIKKPALPTPSRKEKYMKDNNNIAKAKASYARRHGGLEPNKKQLDHELGMGYNLRRAGISDESEEGRRNREEFFNNYLRNQAAIDEARSTVGENASDEVIENELERRFEIRIRAGITDEKELTAYINSAKKFVKENNNIKNPSNGQIHAEVIQRLNVRDSYHIDTGSIEEINAKITDIRRDEEKFVKESTDKEGARAVLKAQRASAEVSTDEPEAVISKVKLQRKFFTDYSTREMADSKIMEKAEKDLFKDLQKIGGTTSERRKREIASEIVRECQQMAGIEIEGNNN